MRRPVLVAASLAAAAATVAPAARAQTPRTVGGVGLSVWGDAYFRGESSTFRTAVRDLRRYGLDRRISSLRVPAGALWEACEGVNFTGRCQQFSGEEQNLKFSG